MPSAELPSQNEMRLKKSKTAILMPSAELPSQNGVTPF